MTPKTEGSLIVFEGIDGSGKSTQLKMLARTLRDHGYDVVETREPTDGSYGQKIRRLYLNRDKTGTDEELELFLADRREHVRSVIAPSLQAGKIVLCDRYYLSTAAYQGAAGLDPQDILERNSFAPEPDLALLFELEVDEGIKRITEQRGDRLNDFEQRDALKKVAAVFKLINLPYIIRIDASGDLHQVSREVREIVADLLRNPEIREQNSE